jgi:Uma2 family endonuclease
VIAAQDASKWYISDMKPGLYAAHPPQAIRWSKSIYYQMAEMGWFRDKRVELIHGEIIEMAAMGTIHLTAVGMALRALMNVFGTDYVVAAPGVLDLSPASEPEPDIAVYRDSPEHLAQQKPRTASLVVEVSDTSLRYDRTTKAELYAGANLPEYWIVNPVDRVVEVHRDPAEGSDGSSSRYMDVRTYMISEEIAPLALPAKAIRVKDLMPLLPGSI